MSEQKIDRKKFFLSFNDLIDGEDAKRIRGVTIQDSEGKKGDKYSHLEVLLVSKTLLCDGYFSVTGLGFHPTLF